MSGASATSRLPVGAPFAVIGVSTTLVRRWSGMVLCARPHALRAAAVAATIAATVITLAGCSTAEPAPPPRTYTAWVSSPGNPVTWRFQVNGSFADQGVKQPLSTAEAYVELPVAQGEQVAFTVEVQRSGFAGCRIVRDDGVEVVPLQQQRLSLDGTAPAAECAFTG